MFTPKQLVDDVTPEFMHLKKEWDHSAESRRVKLTADNYFQDVIRRSPKNLDNFVIHAISAVSRFC